MADTVALLRGINVGGHRRIGMPELAACFRDAGLGDVRTYIQSGNVVFGAGDAAGAELESSLERTLEQRFEVPIAVMVRTRDELAAVVAAAPPAHGSPELRSDVFFVKSPLTPDDVVAQLPELDPEVDAAAIGPGVVYFSRVDARADESRLGRFMGRRIFREITVRNWRTTTTLLRMLDEPAP